MTDRDGDSGRSQETYPVDELVDALEGLGGSAGAEEVADAVGCKYRTANVERCDLKDGERVSARMAGISLLMPGEEDA